MRLDQADPPYVQIARHYQRQITTGELQEGDRLPPIRSIAEEWGVVRGTAARAVRYLESAQLIRTTRSGTYVRRRAAPAPHDRMRMSGHQVPGEDIEIREAGLVRRPYVAGILGLDANAEIVRREFLIYLEGRPSAFGVQWTPGEFAEVAPELTSLDPVDITEVSQRAGRAATKGGDSLEARAADAREAEALELDVGAPVLASVTVRTDATGVVAYGEYVLPQRQTVTYEYEIPGDES